MAVVVSKTGRQEVQSTDFSAKKVEQTTVSAKFTGKKVNIPKDCFLWSNHFIECTNGYLEGKKKLHKFWYRSWMFYLCINQLYVAYCFACFFVWIHLGFAIGVFICSLLLFTLGCQYIMVCSRSLHLVRKQPVVDGLSSLNDFVEVNVNHLSAEYAVARDAGYGRLCAESGMIEFQVFNREAVKYMNTATARSGAIFCLSMAQLVWAFIWICVGAASNGSVIASLKWGSE